MECSVSLIQFHWHPTSKKCGVKTTTSSSNFHSFFFLFFEFSFPLTPTYLTPNVYNHKTKKNKICFETDCRSSEWNLIPTSSLNLCGVKITTTSSSNFQLIPQLISLQTHIKTKQKRIKLFSKQTADPLSGPLYTEKKLLNRPCVPLKLTNESSLNTRCGWSTMTP